jgi:hypothetical protein
MTFKLFPPARISWGMKPSGSVLMRFGQQHLHFRALLREPRANFP